MKKTLIALPAALALVACGKVVITNSENLVPACIEAATEEGLSRTQAESACEQAAETGSALVVNRHNFVLPANVNPRSCRPLRSENGTALRCQTRSGESITINPQ